MITVDQNNPILKEDSTICVLNIWDGHLENLKQEMTLITSYFPKNTAVDFLYFMDENQRELSEQWNDPHTVFVSKKDFNVFGQLKNKSVSPFFNQNHDLLLTLFFKHQKGVKNIFKLKNHSYSCGAELESLPNFDFSFRLKKIDSIELLKQIKKYLISQKHAV